MDNDTGNLIKPNEAADRMGIDSVTLRKYAHALESFDYQFKKTGRNREYTSGDLEIFASMQFLVKKGMTRVDAAETVLNKFGILTNSNTVLNVTPSNASNDSISTSLERYGKQLDDTDRNVQEMKNEIIDYFDNKFTEQNDFFSKKVEQTWKEREKNLQITQTLETSKKFVAAVEEETGKRIEKMSFTEKLKLLFKK